MKKCVMEMIVVPVKRNAHQTSTEKWFKNKKSKNTADRRNLKYQREGKEGRQSESNKGEEKLQERKDEQRLKGDVNFEVFQGNRESLSQEE